MKNKETHSYLLINAVINKLCGRNGFDDWWHSLDSDTKLKIKTELSKIVLRWLDD